MKDLLNKKGALLGGSGRRSNDCGKRKRPHKDMRPIRANYATSFSDIAFRPFPPQLPRGPTVSLGRRYDGRNDIFRPFMVKVIALARPGSDIDNPSGRKDNGSYSEHDLEIEHTETAPMQFGADFFSHEGVRKLNMVRNMRCER